MRLEHGMNTRLWKGLSSRLKGRADLGRMVSVVINDRRAPPLALLLESPMHALELFERLADNSEVDSERQTDRNRCQSIANVVGTVHR